MVDPHLFGPLWRFNEEFTTLDAAGRPTGYRNLDLLRSRTAPGVLRRRKEEVLADLPERLVSRLSVPMTAAQRDFHDDAESIAGQLLARLKKRPLTPVEEQRLMRAFQRARMSCDAAGAPVSLMLAERAAPGPKRSRARWCWCSRSRAPSVKRMTGRPRPRSPTARRRSALRSGLSRRAIGRGSWRGWSGESSA